MDETKNINVDENQSEEVCPQCGGLTTLPCPMCKGTGCRACWGKGKFQCPRCQGRGMMPKEPDKFRVPVLRIEVYFEEQK